MQALNQSEMKNWKRPFFAIFIGQAFSLLGSQLVQFALIWYLTSETRSATVLATATLAAMLPQVVLSPFAGSFVDRGNRRRIMIMADTSIALATILLAVLFATGLVQVWHIYVLMFVRSLGGSFHSPAFHASTSLMVPKQHMARVQGVNQTLNGGLNIIAAPLGAVMLELLPMQSILAVDVVTAMIAVGSLLFVAIPQPERKSKSADGKQPTFWEDFREGFAYVLGWKGMMIVLLMATAINFLFTPASALTPLLVSKYFGGGAIELGWFEAAFSLGVIGGGILLGIWGGFKRRIVTVMIGLMLMGAAMAVVGIVPATGLATAIAAMAFCGILVPITNGSLGAIFQTTVDPAIQGRFFTLVGSLAHGMSPLSLAVAGPLADRLGIQTWFLVGGILCALMGVLGFFLPAVMKVEDGRTDNERKVTAAASAK